MYASAATTDTAICAGCGVIVPNQNARQCVICGDQRPALHVSARASAFWTAVECTFRCRACGHDSPLNQLDIDGSVQCLHCGIDQRFGHDHWREALEHAHAVGDLAGPDPRGRFPSDAPLDGNPFAELGRTKTFVEAHHADDQHQVVIRAMPGHPLCSKCRAPLAIAAQTREELTLACSSCPERARYRLPAGADRLLPALAGVIATEHQLDRTDVQLLEDSGGAVAIRCPNCTAPLPIEAARRAIHCGYCGIAARVPESTLRRLGRADPKPERWWLLFSAPSEQRARLERATIAERQRADKYARRELDRQRELARAATAPLPKRKSPDPRAMVPYVFAGMLTVGAGATYFALQQARQSSAPVAPEAPAATAPAAASVARPPPPKLALEWRGKLTRAQGKSLAPRAECSAKLEADGPSVRWLAVSCGDERLYDSRTPMSGMSMRTAVLGEAPHADHPGKLGYALVYRDTGTRSGRAEIQLDTTRKQAIVSSENIPQFRVEIAFETTSLPRAGAPIFETPARIVPRSLKLAPTSSSGFSPPLARDCRLEIEFVNSQAGAVTCGAKLACGQRWLYGKQDSPGFLACRLGADERPISARDEQQPSADGTPALELDLAARRVSLSSEEDARRAEFSIEP